MWSKLPLFFQAETKRQVVSLGFIALVWWVPVHLQLALCFPWAESVLLEFLGERTSCGMYPLNLQLLNWNLRATTCWLYDLQQVIQFSGSLKESAHLPNGDAYPIAIVVS